MKQIMSSFPIPAHGGGGGGREEGREEKERGKKGKASVVDWEVAELGDSSARRNG